MKILSAGDLHWEEHKRFEECAKVHAFMVNVAREERVDLFVCPGDVYERLSSPREREAVAAWLTAMAEVCPVLVAKGNHDRPVDLALMRRLQTEHPIIVEEAAGVHYVAGAAVALVAWPDRAMLASALQGGSSVDLDGAAQECLRAVLRGLGAQMAEHPGPRLLAGHFMVDGSVTSVGQPLIGHSMNVALSDLALADVPLVLMAHIHAPQQWSYGGCEIIYTGSPYRTTYGEVEEKSVVLAEFDGPGLASWRRIPTPCAPMLLLEDEWGMQESGTRGWLVGLHGLPKHSALIGAEIRLRYRVPADMREEARLAAEAIKADLLARGAADVKLDPEVIAAGEARAPEVARARTLPDKLLALWKARQAIPPEPRAQRLFAKVADLEAKAS